MCVLCKCVCCLHVCVVCMCVLCARVCCVHVCVVCMCVVCMCVVCMCVVCMCVLCARVLCACVLWLAVCIPLEINLSLAGQNQKSSILPRPSQSPNLQNAAAGDQAFALRRIRPTHLALGCETSSGLAYISFAIIYPSAGLAHLMADLPMIGLSFRARETLSKQRSNTDTTKPAPIISVLKV